MKNQFSFIKKGLVFLIAVISFTSIGITNSYGQQVSGSTQIQAYELEAKKELEVLKKELSLSKEQEVEVLNLLVLKNSTLSLPDQTSPRIPLTMERITEELKRVLNEGQLNKLRSNKEMLSELNLTLNK
jgi:ABC-type uncharacterized transport system ATPase subunit